MALLQRTLLKINPIVFMRVVSKNHSTESSIKKSVFISQSKDIYTNLALQDWIYKNVDLSKHHILMLWQNDPCVTIGEDQNPWLETNVDNLPNITESGVKLARQKTDGNAMYHDSGNLNMSFFTPAKHFSDKYNMQIVARALFREYSLKMDVNQEDFMIRGNYNISGSTKKIGTTNAYHHSSLLVSVNKVDFTQCLKMQQEIGIRQENNKGRTETKVMNICEENTDATVKNVLKTIGWEYMRTPAFAIRDGGHQLANKQKGFQLINPTESWFPGIAEIRDNLTSWDWIYGKTPDFKVTRQFRIPENLDNHPDDFCGNLSMSVNGGIIKDIAVSTPSNMSANDFIREVKVVAASMIGLEFTTDLLSNLQDTIKKLVDDKEKFISDCSRQVMTSS